MKTFDYLIVGGGASGLLLAEAMGADPWFGDKRIALLEREAEKQNDRTWCFWEQETDRFKEVIHRSWNQFQFKDSSFATTAQLRPLRYNMIRGVDFYQGWKQKINTYSNLSLIYSQVTALEETDKEVRVITDAGEFLATRVFTSVGFSEKASLMHPFPVLQQHFIGWRIKTDAAVFDPETPMFMDFSVPQLGNTRFMYVLPFSENEALLEYTLFSADLLEDGQYEEAIKSYIKGLPGKVSYQIIEVEKGVIPMTCNDFAAADSSRITHIGIAGGWAKPSTGYTFWSSVQKTSKLIQAIKAEKSLKMARKDRFWFYDLIMLEVLHQENESGSQIFSALFKKLPPTLILRFLHEQTSFAEDLKIIWACPKLMFIKALWRTGIKKFFGGATPQKYARPA